MMPAVRRRVVITGAGIVSPIGAGVAAFWDALAGGPGWPGECVLRFVNTAQLKSIDGGRFYGALIKIAQDSRAVQVIVE